MSGTMTEQALFILRNGKISQWNLSHKKLLPVTDRGRRAVPYSSDTAKQYWEEWKENNQVVDGDVYDAIFLSEHLDDFGELPKWICANSIDKSAWTFKHLSLLAKENEFAQGVWLVQGNVKRLIGAEKADNAIELCLKSSLAFILPRDVAKPKKRHEKVSAKGCESEGKTIPRIKDSALAHKKKSSAKKRGSAKKALQQLKDFAMTYEEALSAFGINLDLCFSSSRFIDVPVGANLERVIDYCPEGSTLKLAAGTYTIPNNRMLYIDKNIRVIGVSPKHSIIDGHFCCKDSITLAVENLSMKEVHGGCVHGPKKGFLIVRNCRFDGGGIDLWEGCMGVVSDVFVDEVEKNVIVSEDAKAIILDSRLTNMTEQYIIGFENSRVYCENVRMYCGNSRNKHDCGNSCNIWSGINAGFEGSRWFLRRCSVGNIKATDKWHGNGIRIGNLAKVCLDDVSFDSVATAAVKNDGFCEYHNIRISQCGKELEGKGNYALRSNPIQLPEDFFV